jgi:hypothetical protein
VNGDNNKVEQDSSSPGTNSSGSNSNSGNSHSFEDAPNDSIFDKPMIKKPTQEGGSNVFAQGALVVKKV